MPAPTDAHSFLAGAATAEHYTTALTGTFAAGYDAGFADGFPAGYGAAQADAQASHAALWEQLGPRVESAIDTAARKAKQAADAPSWPAWDPVAERDRCARSFGAKDFAALVAEVEYATNQGRAAA